jgi:hypothetical protein
LFTVTHATGCNVFLHSSGGSEELVINDLRSQDTGDLPAILESWLRSNRPKANWLYIGPTRIHIPFLIDMEERDAVQITISVSLLAAGCS